MKRFQFRLAAVLRLRRAEQEQARLALAEANTRLTALLLERDRKVRRYDELAGRTTAVDGAGLLAERHEAELALLHRLEADQRVAEAAGVATLAQVAWVRAHRRVQALERLEARRREEHDLAVLHEEITLLDDIATARYLAAAAERDRPAPAGAR